MSSVEWARLVASKADLQDGRGRDAPPREVRLEELARHFAETDCWICLRRRVYNITHYVRYHPGGANELMRGAGDEDATALFEEVHSYVSIEGFLKRCYIGPLVSTPTPWFRAEVVSRTPLSADAYHIVLKIVGILAPPNSGVEEGKSHATTSPRELEASVREWRARTAGAFRSAREGPSSLSSVRYVLNHVKLRARVGGANRAIERVYTPVTPYFARETSITDGRLGGWSWFKSEAKDVHDVDCDANASAWNEIHLIVKRYTKKQRMSWWLTGGGGGGDGANRSNTATWDTMRKALEQEVEEVPLAIQFKSCPEPTLALARDGDGGCVRLGFLVVGSGITPVLQLLCAATTMETTPGSSRSKCEFWVCWILDSPIHAYLLSALDALATRMESASRLHVSLIFRATSATTSSSLPSSFKVITAPRFDLELLSAHPEVLPAPTEEEESTRVFYCGPWEFEKDIRSVLFLHGYASGSVVKVP